MRIYPSVQVFDHVIEYLRTVRFSDAELPLPRGRAELALLVREADFYGLPGLSAKVLRCRHGLQPASYEVTSNLHATS